MESAAALTKTFRHIGFFVDVNFGWYDGTERAKGLGEFAVVKVSREVIDEQVCSFRALRLLLVMVLRRCNIARIPQCHLFVLKQTTQNITRADQHTTSVKWPKHIQRLCCANVYWQLLREHSIIYKEKCMFIIHYSRAIKTSWDFLNILITATFELTAWWKNE